MDIREFSWQHISTLTEEADKRRALEWFVGRVRAGKTVNRAVMEFIADGVEQHLAGKKPWGAKRGVKKRSVEEAMRDALPIYTVHERICQEFAVIGSLDLAAVRTWAADELKVSEDTVRRAVELVQKQRWTFEGKRAYDAWYLEQLFKRWVESPEGRAFLQTGEGREMYKESPFIDWSGNAPTLRDAE